MTRKSFAGFSKPSYGRSFLATAGFLVKIVSQGRSMADLKCTD